MLQDIVSEDRKRIQLFNNCCQHLLTPEFVLVAESINTEIRFLFTISLISTSIAKNCPFEIQ